MTDYLKPSSLAQALAMRAAHADYALLAGGTDLMVGWDRRPPPSGVIDLFGLAELTGVAREAGWIRIGAATTYADLLASEIVRADLPALAASAREVGAVQIQQRGTLGGNVATSSPVGDTLPVLLALDARVLLVSQRGARTIPYTEFITGYRRTALQPDELIASLSIPAPPPGTRQCWRKVGTRRAQAISKVMFAATARLDSAGRVEHARVAFGAVADRPFRIEAAEQVLLGELPSPVLAERAGQAVMAAVRPIGDVRSTADYRRVVAGNLARRFVLGLVASR